MRLQPVILSGGSGSRLWPLSRAHFPKQLLPLTEDRTMLEATATRLDGLDGIELLPTLVVCNEQHRFSVADQMHRHGKPGAIILEPAGRNTAPALTLAALAAARTDPECALLVMPADHVIQDRIAFHRAILAGLDLVRSDSFVTFGVVPTSAETGYGYIRRGRDLAAGAYAVDRFVEKPDLATARHYLESGDYYWNSGMFLLRPRAWLDAIAKFRPDIAAAARLAFEKSEQDRDFLRVDRAAFERCPSDSIDYAVMERLTGTESAHGSLAVIPLDAGWSDVGSWSALWQVGDKDAHGNVSRGDTLLTDCRDSLVISEHRLTACLGLEEMLVIETADAVLVARKDQAQEVKRIVAELEKKGRNESVTHRWVPRPWGAYESIDAGERFQVKRITVRPGASLSLQMHHHRAEHWIVVKGTARVTCGEQTVIVSENQSTYIPLGTPHRLENPGVIPLELIEVQSGSYLGEDDIVRFEDVYGR